MTAILKQVKELPAPLTGLLWRDARGRWVVAKTAGEAEAVAESDRSTADILEALAPMRELAFGTTSSSSGSGGSGVLPRVTLAEVLALLRLPNTLKEGEPQELISDWYVSVAKKARPEGWLETERQPLVKRAVVGSGDAAGASVSSVSSSSSSASASASASSSSPATTTTATTTTTTATPASEAAVIGATAVLSSSDEDEFVPPGDVTLVKGEKGRFEPASMEPGPDQPLGASRELTVRAWRVREGQSTWGSPLFCFALTECEFHADTGALLSPRRVLHEFETELEQEFSDCEGCGMG